MSASESTLAVNGRQDRVESLRFHPTEFFEEADRTISRIAGLRFAGVREPGTVFYGRDGESALRRTSCLASMLSGKAFRKRA